MGFAWLRHRGPLTSRRRRWWILHRLEALRDGVEFHHRILKHINAKSLLGLWYEIGHEGRWRRGEAQGSTWIGAESKMAEWQLSVSIRIGMVWKATRGNKAYLVGSDRSKMARKKRGKGCSGQSDPVRKWMPEPIRLFLLGMDIYFKLRTWPSPPIRSQYTRPNRTEKTSLNTPKNLFNWLNQCWTWSST